MNVLNAIIDGLTDITAKIEAYQSDVPNASTRIGVRV